MTMKSIRLVVVLLTISFQTGAIAQIRPAYETEVWPETRTLVWAHPGQTGDLGDPNNWRLENGDPVKTAPDRDTDIVLPASDKSYRVNAVRQHVRHVTIERGGMLIGKHRSETWVWGNLWVKTGARAYFVAIRGPKHTFFRIDAAKLPSESHPVPYGHTNSGANSMENMTQIAHKFQVCKYGDASVEFLGKFGVSDELMVQHGRMIINGDLRWSGVTGKGALEIYNEAIVELQSGATIGPLQGDNKRGLFNVVLYSGGRLQAGSPERPLESDAQVMLGFNDEGWGRTGLFASEGSTIEVFSKDPKKARLVFTSLTSQADYCDGKCRKLGDPETGANGDLGIKVHLIGSTRLNGVMFDYVANNGILLKDEDAWQSWENVSLGSHNAGNLEMLVTKAERLSLAGKQGYDSKPLTSTSLKNMDAYMREHDPYKLTSTPASMVVVGEDLGVQEAKPVVFEGTVDVTLSSALSGAALHYTTDGSTPEENSPLYTKPISLSKTTILRARAFKRGMPPSPYFSVTYTVE
ncbi:chitobiase/beta-hexosaminidase C-terminal domain-containing protein [Planctomycetota bacterium]